MHWDWTFHIGELFVVVALAWKGNRVLNRWMSMLQDFPPHRHEGKKIFYPKGMAPEPATEMDNGKVVGV